MDWRNDAACREDSDPDRFFPIGTTGPSVPQIAAAKATCAACPVTADCLAEALDSGLDSGIYGGMTEDERRALKLRNARTRARSNA